MSNHQKFLNYVEDYKKLILNKSDKKYDELYKWKAVKIFQDNWNIEAKNLKSMIELCFKPVTNLWVGQNFFPLKMILLFSELNSEKVRNAFRNLFDEQLDLLERTSTFERSCDELLEEYNKLSSTSYKLHYQNIRIISLYLFFKYPEKYFLFKFSMYKKYCVALGYEIPVKGTNKDLSKYFSFANEIRQSLIDDNELLTIHKARLDETCYQDPSYNLLTQDFIYCVTTYLADPDIKIPGTGPVINEPPEKYNNKRFWLYAPGPGANHWDEFYANGKIAIGWGELGDLNKFQNRDEMGAELRKKYPSNKGNNKHNTLALWNFSRDIKPGDIVIAKKGTSDYLGYGIVIGNYEYDPKLNEYSNIRRIEWKKKGIWPETEGQIVTKTLTDITKYPLYVERLIKLIGIEEEEKAKNKLN
jgi:5-methylcytosine-specific restriction protein B